MPDAESAVGAWLDSVETHREITIAERRLAKMGELRRQAAFFALLIEIMSSLDLYGHPDYDPDPPEQEFPEEDEDDEQWKKAS